MRRGTTPTYLLRFSDGVGSSGATYYIHDNRFVDATTAINGSTSVAHNNLINGTYTA